MKPKSENESTNFGGDEVKNAIGTIAIVAVMLYGLSFVGQAVTDGLGGMVDGVDSARGQNGHEAAVDLYVKPQPHPLKKEYPELFTTEGIVVAFGADWCAACRRQAVELRGPSQRYNILKVTVDEERWAKLADKLELGPSIPVVVVIQKGEVEKVFHGFTPWAEIKPHAKKAKKSDDDKKNNIDIGPIHIDWDDDGVNIDGRRRNKPRP